MSADALTVGCKRNVKPEMAELNGKRLIIAAELEEGMQLNTSTVIQLCSTDEIEAEKKYKDVPTARDCRSSADECRRRYFLPKNQRIW